METIYSLFRKEMKEAGLDTYDYKGRFYYEGPAVNVDSLDEAMSHSSLKLQWDQMGLGYVVYPVKHQEFPENVCYDCLERLVYGFCPSCQKDELIDYMSHSK